MISNTEAIFGRTADDQAADAMSPDQALPARMRPIRVLNVIPSVSLVDGGTTRALLNTEEALATSAVEVTTLATDDNGPGLRHTRSTRPPSPQNVARVYSPKRTEFYKVSPELIVWLWRNVKSFDVVHIHALFSFSSIAAGLIARFRGVPYVVQPHGALATYGVTKRRPWLKQASLRLIEAPILRRAAAVLFTSDSELEEARTLGVPHRAVVIPLAVKACKVADPELLLHRHPSLRGRSVVLFMSRLDPKKNVEALLRALAELDDRELPPALLVAGQGVQGYVEDLKALAASLGIADRVVWLGHVEDAEKSAALSLADIFVLPSFSENFGIAAAEAMLAGVPVILGEGVAIAGDIVPELAGISVRPEPKAIANALRQLLGDERLRKSIGQNGQAFAEHEYSMPAMARRLIDLYTGVSVKRPAAA